MQSTTDTSSTSAGGKAPRPPEKRENLQII
jgi:hypothetical protein